MEVIVRINLTSKEFETLKEVVLLATSRANLPGIDDPARSEAVALKERAKKLAIQLGIQTER